MLRNTPKPFLCRLAAVLAVGCAISLSTIARAQDPGDQQPNRDVSIARQVERFHQLHIQMLRQSAKAHFREAREIAQLRARARRGDKLAIRALKARRVENDEGPIAPDFVAPPRAAGIEAHIPRSSAFGTNVIPTNVRTNNPAGDGATAGQCEESVAALGNNIVVAWNDGQGFNTGGDVQGFGWSSDGGVTWTDGGSVLHPPGFPKWRWTSDPVMAVNEKTGDFWYCGLADPDSITNAVAVARGRFTAGVFAFDSVFIVRQVSNATTFLDKQWIAVDSLSGNVYVSNTTFASLDDIDFYRSTTGGRSWPAFNVAVNRLSSPADAGAVQGSRVAVGPNGEVYCVWQALEQGATDFDHFRIRKSTDFGATFAAQVTAADYISNFGTGAPGFNRGRGITFPSITVDRTRGPHRGRVYLAWNESWDWLNDPFTPTTNKSETDTPTNNATNSTAATANTFTVGQILRGTLATTSNTRDLDYWAVTLNAGDRFLVYADSITTLRAFSLRLFAPSPDNSQLLCYAAVDSTSGQTFAVWNFMAPTTGTYFLRLAGNSFRTMNYRVRTAFGVRASERGRDQRDAFVGWSDDGTTWSVSQLNDNATGFDDWLPEVTVGADGMPYAMWFDNRDDTYGSRTHVYMTRSADGGAVWAANQRVTDAQSNFSTCPVNIAPNMGDYSHITASSTTVWPVWADGRAANANVDVYTAGVRTTSSIVSCPADSNVSPNSTINVSWSVQNDNPLFSGTYGIALSSTRNWPLPPTSGLVVGPQANAAYPVTITIPDTAAAGNNPVCLTVTTPGGVVVGQCCFTLKVLSVAGVGPDVATLSLSRPSPNPSSTNTRIAFSLPHAGHAKLNVYDLAGARVRTLVDGPRAAGPNAVVWDGRDDGGRLVHAGAFFYRLEFEGRTLNQRLVMMR